MLRDDEVRVQKWSDEKSPYVRGAAREQRLRHSDAFYVMPKGGDFEMLMGFHQQWWTFYPSSELAGWLDHPARVLYRPLWVLAHSTAALARCTVSAHSIEHIDMHRFHLGCCCLVSPRRLLYCWLLLLLAEFSSKIMTCQSKCRLSFAKIFFFFS